MRKHQASTEKQGVPSLRFECMRSFYQAAILILTDGLHSADRAAMKSPRYGTTPRERGLHSARFNGRRLVARRLSGGRCAKLRIAVCQAFTLTAAHAFAILATIMRDTIARTCITMTMSTLLGTTITKQPFAVGELARMRRVR